MNKKFLPVLFIILAIVVVILFFKDSIKKLFTKPTGETASNNDTADTKTVATQTAINAAQNVPSAMQAPNSTVISFPLHMGSRGEAVKVVQRFVGATADGVWGPKTTAAVIKKGYGTSIDQNTYSIMLSGHTSTGIFKILGL